MTFDRSLMAPAEFEFVVVADTHYMLDPGGGTLEFQSRRKQTARADAALRLAASLGADFILHMGDLVQEYPESLRHNEAISRARAQLARLDAKVRIVAGNHDVGDKPDPTMPTRAVTSESLKRHHALFGDSWYSFDHQDCHFVVINSQILNTGLPESVSQRDWLEHDLATHGQGRVFLFLHLPPFLEQPDEPHLGNYDNIGQPARRWLLDLTARYGIDTVCAAHVHFAFLNRIGTTRIHNVPSTSFVRPGFSHLFTGSAPPEQGRDDAPKLGFHLFRVFRERTDVHFIRTMGALALDDAATAAPKRLLTRVSTGLPASPLGLTLLHPLVNMAEIPIVFPSIVRQRVRNDYPLLSAVELGASAVRFPASDLDDSRQRERLEVLSDEGLRLMATLPASSAADLLRYVRRHADAVDAWEVQIPGALLPSGDLTEALVAMGKDNSIHISLAPILAGEVRPGKQHPRTRIGYLPAELSDLNDFLAEHDVSVDRAVCRLDGNEPWKTGLELPDPGALSHVKAVDLVVSLVSCDDARNANAAAESLFCAALLPGARVYFDPFVDLDRTLDAAHGLLNTSCNPRPAFHVLRCLNSVLYRERVSLKDTGAVELPGTTVRTLTGGDCLHALITSERGELPDLGGLAFPGISGDAPSRLYRLSEGTVQAGPFERLLGRARGLSSPVLLTSDP